MRVAIGCLLLFCATGWARSPISGARLALLQEASLRSSERERLPLPVPPPPSQPLGSIFNVFEQQVSLPILGLFVLRKGQLPADSSKAQPEKLVQSGRLWEKLLNGFERWTSVYQSSIQIVKTLD